VFVEERKHLQQKVKPVAAPRPVGEGIPALTSPTLLHLERDATD
jgi:hypothetical protein